MHSLWDDVAGLGPGRLVTRLILREAGLACEGASADEAFIRELARILVVVEGRHASSKLPGAISRKQSGGLLDTTMAFENTLGCRLGVLGAKASVPWERRHAPVEIPQVAVDAVAGGMESDRRGGRVRKQLPLLAESLRVLGRERAGSVIRERVTTYLQSPEGREWWSERAALLGAD
jgi:hypothetical protein